MKRFHTYLVLVLVLCSMAGVSLPIFAASDLEEGVKELAQQISTNMGAMNKKKIAVVEFSDLSGNITAFGQFLAEELITQLFISSPGQFEVVERRQIMKVLNEQQLTMTGLLDANAMESVGKILGIDAIVTGSMADLGNNIKVNARLIGVDTAKIFAVASTSIPKVGTVAQLIEQEVMPTQLFTSSGQQEVTKPSSQPTQLLKVRVEEEELAYTFQNSFVKVTLQSIYKSKDQKKINTVFHVVNITEENIYLAVNASRKTVLLDEKGETWQRNILSGIDAQAEQFPAKTLFTPNTITTIGMVFTPQGESDGLTFDIVLNLTGEVKGKHVVFTVGFSGIGIME